MHKKKAESQGQQFSMAIASASLINPVPAARELFAHYRLRSSRIADHAVLASDLACSNDFFKSKRQLMPRSAGND